MKNFKLFKRISQYKCIIFIIPFVSLHAQTPYEGTPQQLPGVLLLEKYDEGGEGVAYHDIDAENKGIFRADEGVDVPEITPGSEDYAIGWISAGEYLKYTINIQSSGLYEIEIAFSSGTTGGSCHLKLNDFQITESIGIPGTGGWSNYDTISFTDIYLVSGTHLLTLYFETSGYNLDFIKFNCTGQCSNDEIPAISEFTANENTYEIGDTVLVNIESLDVDGTVDTIFFFAGNEPVDTLYTNMAELKWKAASTGLIKLKAIAVDNENNKTTVSFYITVKDSISQPEYFEIQAIDFEYSAPVYKDKQEGVDILAVTPASVPVSGFATTVFAGDSGSYDVHFYGVGENDGQSVFKIYVNDTIIGQVKLQLSESAFEFGDDYNFNIRNVILKKNDTLKVEAQTASSDGQEWSRARWQKLAFQPRNCQSGNWIEREGYVIIEMEYVNNLASPWKVYHREGTLGDGYIQFNGNNSLGSPAAGSELNYQVQINTPGTYEFAWLSRNGFTAQKFDQENDSWLKIESDNTYTIDESNEVHDANDQFVKYYINTYNQGGWKFNGQVDYLHIINQKIFATYNNPGVYTISVAGRSKGHVIDRMAMFLTSKASIAKDPESKESLRSCDDAPAKPILSMNFSQKGYTTLDTAIITARAIGMNGNVVKNLKCYLNGALIETINDSYGQFFISDLPGYYNTFDVVATDEYNNTSSLNTILYVQYKAKPLGLENQKNNVSVEIYPNPVKSSLKIVSVSEILSAKIIALNGSIIESVNELNSVHTEFDCKNLPDGFYILEIVSTNGLESRKTFIINK